MKKSRVWIHLAWLVAAMALMLPQGASFAELFVIWLPGAVLIDVLGFFGRVWRKIDRWLDA
jgi:hypothetical protein